MNLLEFKQTPKSNIIKCYLCETEYLYNIGIRGGWSDWANLIISIDALLHNKGPYVVSIDMPIQFHRQDMVVISRDIPGNISVDYYRHHVAEKEKFWYKKLTPKLDLKQQLPILNDARKLIGNPIFKEEVSIYD